MTSYYINIKQKQNYFINDITIVNEQNKYIYTIYTIHHVLINNNNNFITVRVSDKHVIVLHVNFDNNNL